MPQKPKSPKTYKFKCLRFESLATGQTYVRGQIVSDDLVFPPAVIAELLSTGDIEEVKDKDKDKDK